VAPALEARLLDRGFRVEARLPLLRTSTRVHISLEGERDA
jgi:hypothetical protein